MISHSQETLTRTKKQHHIYSFLTLLLLEKQREFNFGRGFSRLSGRGRKCKNSLEIMALQPLQPALQQAQSQLSSLENDNEEISEARQ